MINILFIGGTGNLSEDCVLEAAAREFQVYVLNRGNKLRNLPHKVIHLKCDINDLIKFQAIVEDLYFDVVVDFLSYKDSTLQNFLTNLSGKFNQYIFISTATVYDRKNSKLIITEKTPKISSGWKYALDKIKCENILQNLGKDVKYTIVRPYITYSNKRIPYGIMPDYGYHWTLIERILNNKPIFLWDNGYAKCTITHTKDFAKALVDLVNNKSAFNEIYNIVSSDVFTWLEILETLEEVLNKKITICSIDSTIVGKTLPQLADILENDRSKNAVFDNSKIKNVSNFLDNSIPLKEGIEKVILHYKTEKYLNGIDYIWDGQIDKLIIRNNKSIDKNLLRFINYNIHNKWTDKIDYMIGRFGSELSIKVYKKLKKIMAI